MARTILFPTDGSGAARNAGEYAVEMARCEGARIVVLGVLHPHYYGDTTEFGDWEVLLADIRRAVDDEVGRLGGMGVEVAGRTWDTPTDQVQDAIEQVALEIGADLIVMGSHGRTGLDRAMLGSVTDRVLRHSTVPVLVVPAHTTSRMTEKSAAAASARA